MSRPRVHVVEDDDDQFFLLEYHAERVLGGLLGGEPPQLVRSTSLAEAVERESAEASALVLLDLGLPDSDLTWTAGRFLAAVPEACVVVLTSLDDDDLADAARRAGARGFVAKSELGEPRFGDVLAAALGAGPRAEESAPPPLDGPAFDGRALDGRALDGPALDGPALESTTAEGLLHASRGLAHDALGAVQIILYRVRALESDGDGTHGDAIRDACAVIHEQIARARELASDGLRPFEPVALGADPLEVRRPDVGPEVVVEPTPPTLVADRRLLEAAASELVDNALRHAPLASRISVEFAPRGGDATALRVAHDGVHVDGLRERFEAALQGRGVEGSNPRPLGLLRVRGIAERHAGHVDLDVDGDRVAVSLVLPNGAR